MGQPLSRTRHCLAKPPSQDKPIAIEIVSTKKERDKVFRFRYQVYVEEMGKKITSAEHRHRLLYDDMDDWGMLLYARAGKDIVGTKRLHMGCKNDFPQEYVDFFAMDKFQEFIPADQKPHKLSFSSKIMVAPHYRSSQALYLLVALSYELGRETGLQFNFCGCAPFMIPLYEKLGLRRYKANFQVPDYGLMIPHVLVVQDIDYLRRIQSPFWRIARRYPNSPEASQWFAREFPLSGKFINSQLLKAPELWQLLTAKLDGAPHKTVGLFHGLTEDEAMICAHTGHILHSGQADTIVHPDDMSNEIYIVLSGVVSVRRQLANRRQSRSLLHPGQVYGKKAFSAHSAHNATVTAQTDAELLVLPRPALERLQLVHPEIAAKLFRNIGSPLRKVVYA